PDQDGVGRLKLSSNAPDGRVQVCLRHLVATIEVLLSSESSKVEEQATGHDRERLLDPAPPDARAPDGIAGEPVVQTALSPDMSERIDVGRVGMDSEKEVI